MSEVREQARGNELLRRLNPWTLHWKMTRALPVVEQGARKRSSCRVVGTIGMKKVS